MPLLELLQLLLQRRLLLSQGLLLRELGFRRRGFGFRLPARVVAGEEGCHLGVARLPGEVERGFAVLVLLGRVGPRVDQQNRALELPLL